MRDSTRATPFKNQVCACTLAGALQLVVHSSLFAESLLESRYQYYQEDHHRIRVDSNYSLFSLDLKDSLVLDGTYLYSAISGATPTGKQPATPGGTVPLVQMKDEREAVSLGLTRQFGNHSLRGGFAYSYEQDYISKAYSLQDTISLNNKNTDLVLGFAFTDDLVGTSFSDLAAKKCSYDTIIGVNQVVGPDDLLSLNLTLGWRQGFLTDPYKVADGPALLDPSDTRPSRKFEQLIFTQWTHYIKPIAASLETSYRFGHNDWGSHSHTARIALYKKFQNNRLTVGPSFRYYRQTAARFYKPSFSDNPDLHSSDYRLSAEETFSTGLQVRWFAVKDKLAFDAGYERYVSRGLDHQTPQMSYPSANSVTIGLHYQF